MFVIDDVNRGAFHFVTHISDSRTQERETRNIKEQSYSRKYVCRGFSKRFGRHHDYNDDDDADFQMRRLYFCRARRHYRRRVNDVTNAVTQRRRSSLPSLPLRPRLRSARSFHSSPSLSPEERAGADGRGMGCVRDAQFVACGK